MRGVFIGIRRLLYKKPGGVTPPGSCLATALLTRGFPYFFDLSISCWRRMRRRSFPTAVRGIASMNSISRGSL